MFEIKPYNGHKRKSVFRSFFAGCEVERQVTIVFEENWFDFELKNITDLPNEKLQLIASACDLTSTNAYAYLHFDNVISSRR